MIKAIDKKYCIDNFVQLMPHTDDCQLIMSTDEIIFLKVDNNILINKYKNHPKRYLFPYSDFEKHNTESSTNYNQLFEYNKMYLNYCGSISNFNFSKNYFFKGTNRALFYKETLDYDERKINKSNEKEEYLTKKELEGRLDSSKFDSMYLIDKMGDILYAKSKKNGIIISKNIVPSNEKIIEKERELRIAKDFIKHRYGYDIKLANEIENEENYNFKSIDEIYNLNIYGPISKLFSKYGHFLITSKEGNFSIKLFKLDFICNDRFKLTTYDVLVFEPTIDDVINYSNRYEIKKTYDPYIEIEYDINDVVENIRIEDSTKIKIIDDEYFKMSDNKKEKGFRKIFKKNI